VDVEKKVDLFQAIMQLSRTACRLLSRNFYTFTPTIPKPDFKLEDGTCIFIKKKPQISENLPPRLREYPPRAKLSAEQIKEIQSKRQSDPDRFTVSQLAKEYNSFPGFIMRITQCPPERKAKLESKANEEFASFSISKKKAIIDRLRRKALW
jgi:hypothetical protein